LTNITYCFINVFNNKLFWNITNILRSLQNSWIREREKKIMGSMSQHFSEPTIATTWRGIMKIGNHWQTIRAVFEEGYKSCVHFAVATVNEDGSPHVTPIGALFLREDRTGFYFEENPTRMPRNLKRNPRVCILAVNADRSFWAKSLLEGKFSSPPAVRLLGTVGELREATADEVAAWQKKIANAKGTKGYKLLWEKFAKVRDISFDSFEPVDVGEMTSGLWQ
jgi:predicted pyridoxine 5'-phosphate oxidase superfamily flavin-nucleotide-binding protein